MCGLELSHHPNLLVGPESADDAGVYRLTEDLALIQTLDFFTPIVDDPFLFGAIAAANALSDVYAMGGRPICAMNIVTFPVKALDIDVLREVMQGGLSKLREAGIPLAGGHSVDDTELKYGLSVTGTVHPDRVWTNRGALAGDRLVLTKPVGTGVVSTALKRGKASDQAMEAATRSMALLNRRAAELLEESGEVHACTDVTGFGLLGHLTEMVQDSPVGATIDANCVPLLPEALAYARQGLTPGGLERNRRHHAPLIDARPSVSPALVSLLHDPQTSGGLLAAVPETRARPLAQRMVEEGLEAAVVGEISERHPGRIELR